MTTLERLKRLPPRLPFERLKEPRVYIALGVSAGLIAVAVALAVMGAPLLSGLAVVLSIATIMNTAIKFVENTNVLFRRSSPEPAWVTEMQRRLDAVLISTGADGSAPPTDIGALLKQANQQEFEAGIKALEEERFEEALLHFEASFSRDLSPDERIERLRLEAEVFWHFGRIEGASDRLREALRLAQAGADHAKEAKILEMSGFIQFQRGQIAQAESAYQRGLELAREAEDKSVQAWFARNLGMLYASRSDYQRAAPLTRDAVELARSSGNTGIEVMALNDLSRQASRRGDRTEAEELAVRGEQVARNQASRWVLGQALMLLGQLAIGRAEMGKAERHLTEAVEIFRQLNSHRPMTFALVLLGQSCMATEPLRAEAFFTEAAQLADAMGDKLATANALGALGGLLLAQSRFDKAEERLKTARAISQEIGALGREAEQTAQLAVLYFEIGDLAKAEAEYNSALGLAKKLNDRRSEAAYLRELARVHIDVHDPARAKERWRKALLIYQDLGDESGAGQVEQELEKLNPAQEQAARD